MRRWDWLRIAEFPQWLRNDAPKIRSKPGFTAMTERIELAADLLDAVYATHAGCKIDVCPTLQAMRRATDGDES
ncbi:hypothetical protein EK0264_03650 [Epidermidibacterium keratini]|uniref:Uncharacterized protein n=1 Tax=Epidermidibacterium keratini TaxID=1891644 RepID=A0A7L4YJJ9_9ACTN|nr:hypothetical protein [Epidermidibacterium keratini]QHB99464.1 hypothetical protein EK0264_03650 [Epidermidibacterium keratini]